MSSKSQINNKRGASSPPSYHKIRDDDQTLQTSENKMKKANSKEAEAHISHLKKEILENFKGMEGIGKNLKSASTIIKLDLDKVILLASKLKLHTRKQKDSLMRALGYENYDDPPSNINCPIDFQEIERIDQESKQLEEDITRIKQNIVKKDNELSSFIDKVLSSKRLQTQIIETVEATFKEINLNFKFHSSNINNYNNMNLPILANENSSNSSARNDSLVPKENSESEQKIIYQKRAKELQKANDLLMNQLQSFHEKLSSSKEEIEKLKNELLKYKRNKNYMTSNINQTSLKAGESTNKKTTNKAYSMHPSEKSENGDDSKNSIQTQKGRIQKNVFVTSNQNRKKERMYSAAPSDDSKSDQDVMIGGIGQNFLTMDRRTNNNENAKNFKVSQAINLNKINQMEVSPANSKWLSIKDSLKFEKISDENSTLRIQISTILSKINSTLDQYEIKLEDAYNKACAFDKKIINELSKDNNKSKIEINSFAQELFSNQGINFNLKGSSNQERREIKSKISSNINQREYNRNIQKVNDNNLKEKDAKRKLNEKERNVSQKRVRPKPEYDKSNRPSSVLQDRIKYLEQEKKEIISKKNDEIYKLSDQIVRLNKQNEFNILRIKSQNSNYPSMNNYSDNNFLYVSTGNPSKRINQDRDSYIRKLEEENDKYKELQIEYSSTCQSFLKNEKSLKLSIEQMKEAVEFKEKEIKRLREKMSNEENVNEKIELLKMNCLKIIEDYSNGTRQTFKEFDESIKEKESRINDLSFLLKSYYENFTKYSLKFSSMNSSNKEILKLKEDLLVATSNLEDYINNSKKYEEEIENLQNENSRVSNLYLNEQLNFKKIESEYQSILGQIDKERKQHKIEIQKLINESKENNEVDKLQKKLSSLETDFKLKVQTLTKKEKILNGTIKSKDTEIKQVKSDIENLTKELTQKDDEIHGLKIEISNLKDESQTKFTKNIEGKMLQESSNEYIAKINDLISDNKKLAKILEEKSSETEKIRKANITKDQLVKKLNLKNAKLTSELSNLKQSNTNGKEEVSNSIIRPQKFKSGHFNTEINTGIININLRQELTPLIYKKNKNIPFSPSLGESLEDQLALDPVEVIAKNEKKLHKKGKIPPKFTFCHVTNITLKSLKSEEQNLKFIEIQKINNKLKENINDIINQAGKRFAFLNDLLQILKSMNQEGKIVENKNKVSNNLKSFYSLGKYDMDEFKNYIDIIPEFFDQINNIIIRLESNYLKAESLTEQNHQLLKQIEKTKKDAEGDKEKNNQIISNIQIEKVNISKILEIKNDEMQSFQNKNLLLQSNLDKTKLEYEGKLKEKEKSLVNSQNVLEEVKSKLEQNLKEKQKLSDSIKVLENKIQEKESKIGNQSKELELVKSGNNDLINKIEMLSNLMEELNLTIQKKDSEINELQVQIEMRKSFGLKSEEADKSPQEMKEDAEKFKLDLNLEKENSKSLKTALEEKEMEYNNLMNEVIQSNKDKNQYQEANIHLQEEIFKITNELNSIKIKFEEEKNQQRLSDSNNENKNMEYQNLKVDFDTISNENEELKIQLDLALKEIENLKYNNTNENIKVQSPEDNIKIEKSEGHHENLENENNEFQNQFHNSKKNQEKLQKQELKNLQKETIITQSNSNEYQKSLNELTSILNNCLGFIIDFINQIIIIEIDWDSEISQKIHDNLKLISQENKENKIINNNEKINLEIWNNNFNIAKSSMALILKEINFQSINMKNHSEIFKKLQQEFEDYKLQLDKSNKEGKKFEAELQSVCKNNTNYISQINIFNKNLKEKEEKLKSKELEIAKLNSAISNLQLENQKYSDQMTAFKLNNSENTKNDGLQKNMIDNLNSKFELIEKQIKDKDDRINILLYEKEDLLKKFDAEKLAMSNENKLKLNSLRTFNDKLKEENQKITKKNQDLEEKISEFLSNQENMNQNFLKDSPPKSIASNPLDDSFSEKNIQNLMNEFELKLNKNTIKIDDSRNIFGLLKWLANKLRLVKTEEENSLGSNSKKEKSNEQYEKQEFLEEKENEILNLKTEIEFKDISLKENAAKIDQLSKFCEEIGDVIKNYEEKFHNLSILNEELKLEVETKTSLLEEYQKKAPSIGGSENEDRNKIEEYETQIINLMQINAEIIKENSDLRTKLEGNNESPLSQSNNMMAPQEIRLHSEGDKGIHNNSLIKKVENESNECNALLKLVKELNIPISLDPSILVPEDYIILIVNFVDKLNKKAAGKSDNRPSRHKFNPILINEFDPIRESNEGKEEKMESISEFLLNVETLQNEIDIQPSIKLKSEKNNGEGSGVDEAFIIDNDICNENNKNLIPESAQINQIKIDYQNQIDLIQLQWEQKYDELNLEKEKINEELNKYKSENDFLKDLNNQIEKPVEDIFDEENEKEANNKQNRNKEATEISSLKKKITELQNKNHILNEELKKDLNLIDWSTIKMEDIKVLLRASYNENEWILIEILNEFHWVKSNEIPDSILFDLLELYMKFLKNEEEQLNERNIEGLEEDENAMIPIYLNRFELINIISKVVYYPNYEIDKNNEKVERLTQDILNSGEKNFLIHNENQDNEMSKTNKVRKNQNKTANNVYDISFKSELSEKDKVDIEHHKQVINELNSLKDKYNESENKLSLFMEQNIMLKEEIRKQDSKGETKKIFSKEAEISQAFKTTFMQFIKLVPFNIPELDPLIAALSSMLNFTANEINAINECRKKLKLNVLAEKKGLFSNFF